MASGFTSITSHSHNWEMFSLWLRLFILSGVIFLFFSGSILYSYLPGEFIFQWCVFSTFILFMRFSRLEYLSGLPFPSLAAYMVNRLQVGFQTLLVPSGRYLFLDIWLPCNPVLQCFFFFFGVSSIRSYRSS